MGLGKITADPGPRAGPLSGRCNSIIATCYRHLFIRTSAPIPNTLQQQNAQRCRRLRASTTNSCLTAEVLSTRWCQCARPKRRPSDSPPPFGRRDLRFGPRRQPPCTFDRSHRCETRDQLPAYMVPATKDSFRVLQNLHRPAFDPIYLRQIDGGIHRSQHPDCTYPPMTTRPPLPGDTEAIITVTLFINCTTDGNWRNDLSWQMKDISHSRSGDAIHNLHTDTNSYRRILLTGESFLPERSTLYGIMSKFLNRRPSHIRNLQSSSIVPEIS